MRFARWRGARGLRSSWHASRCPAFCCGTFFVWPGAGSLFHTGRMAGGCSGRLSWGCFPSTCGPALSLYALWDGRFSYAGCLDWADPPRPALFPHLASVRGHHTASHSWAELNTSANVHGAQTCRCHMRICFIPCPSKDKIIKHNYLPRSHQFQFYGVCLPSIRVLDHLISWLGTLKNTTLGSSVCSEGMETSLVVEHCEHVTTTCTLLPLSSCLAGSKSLEAPLLRSSREVLLLNMSAIIPTANPFCCYFVLAL